jgi:hypothetical protein
MSRCHPSYALRSSPPRPAARRRTLWSTSENELTDALRGQAPRVSTRRPAARGREPLFWTRLDVSGSSTWAGATVGRVRAALAPVALAGVLEAAAPHYFRRDDAVRLKPGDVLVLLGTRAQLDRLSRPAGSA